MNDLLVREVMRSQATRVRARVQAAGFVLTEILPLPRQRVRMLFVCSPS